MSWVHVFHQFIMFPSLHACLAPAVKVHVRLLHLPDLLLNARMRSLLLTALSSTSLIFTDANEFSKSCCSLVTHNSAKLIISGALFRHMWLNRRFLLMTGQTQTRSKETLIRRDVLKCQDD